MISKINYKPRFIGYYFTCGIVKILDGIVTILSFPFGYTCTLYPTFCVWNLRQDVKRKKKNPKYTIKHEAPGQRPLP